MSEPSRSHEGFKQDESRVTIEAPPSNLRSKSSSSMIDSLDEEMKKLFSSSAKLEDFMLPSNQSCRDLVDSVSRHHIDEDDYESHRKVSFPNIHHPLRPIRSSKSVRSHRTHSHDKVARTTSLPESPGDEVDGKHLQIVVDLEKIPSDSAFAGDSAASLGTKKKVGFYVGSGTSLSAMGDAKQEVPPSPAHHATHVPTAAERFQRTVVAEPEPTPMFGGITEQPMASEAAAKPMISVPSKTRVISKDSPSQEVKFHIGEEKSSSDLLNPSVISGEHSHTKMDQSDPSARHGTGNNKKVKVRRHHSHRHHHHHHQQESLRRVPGSEVAISDALKRIPTEKEEALMLKQSDLEDIASHRLGDARGIRRHKMSSKHSGKPTLSTVIQTGLKQVTSTPKPSRTIDHSPHEVFVELDELQLGLDLQWEWKEKARWIKFEEDVEEEAERWGRPHVASLSFHSLLELRRGLEQGSVMLDLDAPDLTTLVTLVVGNMVTRDLITDDQASLVQKVLLLKHTHVSQRYSSIKRNISYHNLQGLLGKSKNPDGRSYSFLRPVSRTTMGSSHSQPSTEKMSKPDVLASTNDSDIKLEEITTGPTAKMDETGTVSFHIPSSRVATPDHQDLEILRKIPRDAEATAVLVGAVDFLQSPAVAFIRLTEGTDLPNLTEVPLPVRFLFILLGPVESPVDYHEIGRSLSTLMSNTRFHDVAYQANDRQDLLSAINEFLDESIVLPPGDWDRKTLLPIMEMARKKAKQRRQKKKELEALMSGEKPEEVFDPLQRTRRCFGGFVNDVKRRYPKYLSDITDAFNFQCVAAFFFIYFAALSPAITFGGLMGEITDNWIGVSEMIMSSALCGLIFSLFAGQPLMIVGATGPIIVFEESMYKFCRDNDWEFLPLRVWIGAWCCVLATIVVAFEGSFLIKYFTRFTQEIFASLISLIFIFETFKKLFGIYSEYPIVPPDIELHPACLNNSLNTTLGVLLELNTTLQCEAEQPNATVSLLSTMLMLGTFFIAFFLRNFRNSKFLGRTARRALGDFGIPIAIFVMVLIDILIKDNYTQKLNVPEGGVTPTEPNKRGWIINPMGMSKPLPIWMIFAAAIPAVLVFILIFMETQITGTIVNKKERNLKKGSGYHLDLMLIGCLPLLCTVLGIPIVCVAAVRSISHVSALSIYSRNYAPGESPKLEGVHEQRVTAFLVSIMVGVSVLMGPILKKIPIAVLFGVFLYMGVASMSGIQLFERVELMLMPIKHHPNLGFVRRVRTFRMHIYTFIQLVCLAVLWVVKSTPASLAFPFVLIIMVPLRKFGLPLIFTKLELDELDRDEVTHIGEEDDDDLEVLDADDEPDFYSQVHMPI